MQHMSKCFQAIDKLKLDNESPPPGVRPKALGMVSCVGDEYVGFKQPLPLEDKASLDQRAELVVPAHSLTTSHMTKTSMLASHALQPMPHYGSLQALLTQPAAMMPGVN
jgi:hypothetical protein